MNREFANFSRQDRAYQSCHHFSDRLVNVTDAPQDKTAIRKVHLDTCSMVGILSRYVADYLAMDLELYDAPPIAPLGVGAPIKPLKTLALD